MVGQPLTKDTLFLALTRPAMLGGVPLIAFVFCFMAAGMLMIVLDSIVWLLAFVPLWMIARLITRHDPNAFRILFCFIETSARCRNRNLWGGASSSPLRLARRYVREEIDL